MSWRNEIQIHPAADRFPLLAPHELRELADDIKKNGLRERIKVINKNPMHKGIIHNRYYRQVVVDGRNRLDALELAGCKVWKWKTQKLGEDQVSYGELDPAIVTVLDEGDDDLPHTAEGELDVESYVASLNIHRRHLTAEQKREVIAKLLKAFPEKSDRQIAKEADSNRNTVGRIREEGEKVGDVSRSDTRVDTKGRQQPAGKPKRPKASDTHIEVEDKDGKVHRLAHSEVRAVLLHGAEDVGQDIQLQTECGTPIPGMVVPGPTTAPVAHETEVIMFGRRFWPRVDNLEYSYSELATAAFFFDELHRLTRMNPDHSLESRAKLIRHTNKWLLGYASQSGNSGNRHVHQLVHEMSRAMEKNPEGRYQLPIKPSLDSVGPTTAPAVSTLADASLDDIVRIVGDQVAAGRISRSALGTAIWKLQQIKQTIPVHRRATKSTTVPIEKAPTIVPATEETTAAPEQPSVLTWQTNGDLRTASTTTTDYKIVTTRKGSEITHYVLMAKPIEEKDWAAAKVINRFAELERAKEYAPIFSYEPDSTEAAR